MSTPGIIKSKHDWLRYATIRMGVTDQPITYSDDTKCGQLPYTTVCAPYYIYECTPVFSPNVIFFFTTEVQG